VKWQVITDTMQGVGGLAGIVALGWQISDFRRRRRAIHWPPELRPVLMKSVECMDEVLVKPRDRDWVKQHIDPLEGDLSRLRHLLPIKYQPHLALIVSNLSRLSATSYSIGGGRVAQKSAEEIAIRAIEQQQAAKDVQKNCRELLRIMSSAGERAS
jgi:hypothetical protein